MDIDALIERSNEIGDSVWVSGAASPEQIEQVEEKLGFSFPRSYSEFLEKYGSISVYDNCISGIVSDDPLKMCGSNIYADTEFLKEEYAGQYEVPDHLIVLMSHEDGAYCFNKNIETIGDEFAIVNYEPHLPEETCSEVLYKTFHEFIRHNLFYNITEAGS